MTDKHTDKTATACQKTPTSCVHCGRQIIQENGQWIDPEAIGDDSIWREVCDSHDTFVAEHEPQAQHSPLPWSIREHQRPERETVTYESGNTFGIYKQNANETVFWAVADEIENEADARLIVASVNNAPALAEALRSLLYATDHIEHIRPQLNKASDALAKWESEAAK